VVLDGRTALTCVLDRRPAAGRCLIDGRRGGKQTKSLYFTPLMTSKAIQECTKTSMMSGLPFGDLKFLNELDFLPSTQSFDPSPYALSLRDAALMTRQ
jgi:hypothetical protein